MSDAAKRQTEVDIVRRHLDGWKEILVLAKRFLEWDQPFYPGVIAGLVTFKFLVLWYIDPTFVSELILMLLFCNVADYLLPILGPKLFPIDKWTSVQENDFQVACEVIVGLKHDTKAFFLGIADMKSQRPRMYLAASLVSLLSIGWIGAALGDLLVFYFISLGVCLYPGAKKQGIIQTYVVDISAKVKDMIFKKSV